jgi:hypothetical protein
MPFIIHRADTRGTTKTSWLNSQHTFSFADYYDPERVGFGALRVLNDDTILAGQGFPEHGHRNMEIITIPLSGAVRHQDSLGNTSVVQTGEVQIMSAGTGVIHAEHNASDIEPLSLLQIWIEPKVRGIAPRYDQKTFDTSYRQDRFQMIISPEHADATLWINQDAYLSRIICSEKSAIAYHLHSAKHGVYIFVVRGVLRVSGELLRARDGVGVWDVPDISWHAEEDAEVLVLEVPMED